jgi:hypothetical protein
VVIVSAEHNVTLGDMVTMRDDLATTQVTVSEHGEVIESTEDRVSVLEGEPFVLLLRQF